MAKSIRSKWRRKCRAVKRERYGQKELERLKKTLTNDPHNKPQDIDMVDLTATPHVKTVTKTAMTRSRSRKVSDNVVAEVDQQMETNNKEAERVFNPKTMRDQHGSYPIWMNHRKINKHKKIEKAKAKKKNKKLRKF